MPGAPHRHGDLRLVLMQGSLTSRHTSSTSRLARGFTGVSRAHLPLARRARWLRDRRQKLSRSRGSPRSRRPPSAGRDARRARELLSSLQPADVSSSAWGPRSEHHRRRHGGDLMVRAALLAPQRWALARARELELRSGVHVGEVELVGERSWHAHEAARVMAAAAPGEIVVSAHAVARVRPAPGIRVHDSGPRGRVAARPLSPTGAPARTSSADPRDRRCEALERITGELQRYSRDYRVICGPRRRPR